MKYFHDEIISRWNNFSIYEQMANIGAEVGRAIKWKNKNQKIFLNAFYRALELIDLTAADKKNHHRLSEILRLRETIADFLVGDNIYKQTEKQIEKYFYYFTLAARENK
ncbi:MAG: hypothetical protein KatS3mg092_0112 [Patescibacteria group bacterium]|nr:MAG: hypothetical protein KatS3mg092_0112 [Patescibacteria group bacterium]